MPNSCRAATVTRKLTIAPNANGPLNAVVTAPCKTRNIASPPRMMIIAFGAENINCVNVGETVQHDRDHCGHQSARIVPVAVPR